MNLGTILLSFYITHQAFLTKIAADSITVKTGLPMSAPVKRDLYFNGERAGKQFPARHSDADLLSSAFYLFPSQPEGHRR